MTQQGKKKEMPVEEKKSISHGSTAGIQLARLKSLFDNNPAQDCLHTLDKFYPARYLGLGRTLACKEKASELRAGLDNIIKKKYGFIENFTATDVLVNALQFNPTTSRHGDNNYNAAMETMRGKLTSERQDIKTISAEQRRRYSAPSESKPLAAPVMGFSVAGSSSSSSSSSISNPSNTRNQIRHRTSLPSLPHTASSHTTSTQSSFFLSGETPQPKESERKEDIALTPETETPTVEEPSFTLFTPPGRDS